MHVPPLIPEDSIRALRLSLLAVAAVVVALVLTRQRHGPERPETAPADPPPHALAPLDLDQLRSAGW